MIFIALFCVMVDLKQLKCISLSTIITWVCALLYCYADAIQVFGAGVVWNILLLQHWEMLSIVNKQTMMLSYLKFLIFQLYLAISVTFTSFKQMLGISTFLHYTKGQYTIRTQLSLLHGPLVNSCVLSPFELEVGKEWCPRLTHYSLFWVTVHYNYLLFQFFQTEWISTCNIIARMFALLCSYSADSPSINVHGLTHTHGYCRWIIQIHWNSSV